MPTVDTPAADRPLNSKTTASPMKESEPPHSTKNSLAQRTRESLSPEDAPAIVTDSI